MGDQAMLEFFAKIQQALLLPRKPSAPGSEKSLLDICPCNLLCDRTPQES